MYGCTYDARKPTLGKNASLIMEANPPLPSGLLCPPCRDPLYINDGARVCHWEFPKYISPCVLLSGEEWPEFHSFLHLFLRFHKRREGDRVSGSHFIRRAPVPRPNKPAFSFASFLSLRESPRLAHVRTYWSKNENRGKSELHRAECRKQNRLPRGECSVRARVRIESDREWLFCDRLARRTLILHLSRERICNS